METSRVPGTPEVAVPALTAWAQQLGVTPTELVVTQHAARGLSNKEIGAVLGSSEATIRTHLLSVSRKVGVSSRGELAHRVFLIIEGALRALGEERELLVLELEKQRSLLDAVLRQLPVGVAIAEAPSGRILLTNDRLGASVEPSRETVYPLARALESGEPVSTEMLHRHADGTERCLKVDAVPIRDKSGLVVACVGTYVDLTERKKLEDVLRAGEERFRVLLEDAPAIIFTTNAEGTSGFVNTRLEEYSGVSPGEDQARVWASVLHPDDVELGFARWRASVAAGKPFEHRVRLRRADGTYRWFLKRVQPVLDAEGRISDWLGSCTDVEDLVKAEAEAKQAVATRDDFLRTVSKKLAESAELLASASEGLAGSTRPLPLDPGLVQREAQLVAKQAKTVRRLIAELLPVGEVSPSRINPEAPRVATSP